MNSALPLPASLASFNPAPLTSADLLDVADGCHAPLFPALVAAAGERTRRRYAEFFAAEIRNAHTRRAYATAVGQFLAWCEARRLSLGQVDPITVAAWIERHPGSAPTRKQHLAALKMFFGYLVSGQVLPSNPAASVRGPRYSIAQGKTPVLDAEQARALLDGIRGEGVVDLRDRALLSVMLFSAARVGAVAGMRVRDYYANGKRFWLRLHEKGGKEHLLPAHHRTEEALDRYLAAAGIAEDKLSPLWRSARGTRGQLSASRAMASVDVFRMVRRRAAAAGLPANTCCHSFRATAITVFLSNGGSLENAQAIAAHSSPKTTKLYDRRGERIALSEIERILI